MTDTETTAQADSQSSALSQLINLFVAPSQALDYADRHPKMWWLPLGITLLFSIALGVWFMLTVNINAWHAMMVHVLSQSHPEAVSRVAHMGRGTLLFGVIGGAIAIVVIELLYALYLFLTDKLFSASNQGYGRWFSFTTWTWLPISLAYIAGMIAWAFANHSTDLRLSDITSLNSLLFHFSPASHFFAATQFSVINIWVIALVTLGLQRWRGHGTGKAIGIAIAPYVVYYGIRLVTG